MKNEPDEATIDEWRTAGVLLDKLANSEQTAGRTGNAHILRGLLLILRGLYANSFSKKGTR